MRGPKRPSAVPAIRTPGIDHKKIILDDCAARVGEINRFNSRLRWALIFVVLGSMIAATFYFSGIWTRENKALESRLETFTELRDETLSRFLTSLNNEVELWSVHPDIVKDAERFIKDWHAFTPQEVQEIRDEYVNGKMPATLSAAQQDYNVFHAEIHSNLERFSRRHGYYDIFIFDLLGNLVYTVEKEDDFGYNFSEGGSEYADSGLGRVYRKALKAQSGDAVFFDSFSPYAPSIGDPAAFLSSPIVDGAGQVIGVYAVQIPISRFNDVLKNAQGLGDTGESYLLNSDLIMQNQSRLTDENTMLVRRVENDVVRKALAGERSLGKAKNLAGQPSIIAAMPLTFKETKYVVATEMALSEKRSPLRPYIAFYIASLLFLLLFGWVAYVVLKARQIRRPGQFADAESS